MKIKIRPRSTIRKREIKIEQFKRMVFHKFQKRDQHCDIKVLSIDGTCIKAHHVILAAKMNILATCATNLPIIQTTIDAVSLQKIIDFCYTDEMCFEGVAQTFGLLNFAKEYDIADLIEKCQSYLNAAFAVKPPSPQSAPLSHKLVIFGGMSSEHCFGAAVLKSLDGKWSELPEMIESQKYARRLASVAYCENDFLIVSGGLDNIRSSTLVNLVDLKSRKIGTLPPMKTGRCEHASIVHNNFLYVAGGINLGVHLDSVEKFDLMRRHWTPMKPMATRRTLFSLVVARDLIYAVGGENEFECMNLVECYDPKRNLWENAPSMIKPRASAGVTVFNNAIYAVGGSTMFNFGDTNTVERYDLDTKQWTLIASMNYSRFNVSCCVYQSTLIAAGGYDFASHAVDHVEVYDERTNKWIRSRAMNKARGRCHMFVTSSDFEKSAA